MTSRQRWTFKRNERKERAQIGALLVNLQRSLEVIKADIEVEERQARWLSPDFPGYPTTACSLRARHDNLAATIRILEDRARQMMKAAA
jgi:hypothetical protein